MELEQSAVQELFTSDAIFVYSIKERHAPVSFSTALPATAWLAAIVESSSDAIISKTLDGIITSWNGAAESLFGYRADEVIGCHISILAAPGKEQEMASIIERIRRNERVQPYETKRRRKDGSLIHVSLTVSPILDEAGHVVGASKIARDITERKKHEERLQLLTSELDHRAKNVLAVAQAMLRLTRADNIDQYMTAVEGRIGALARIHTQVAENRWDGAELGDLLHQGLAPFRCDEQRFCTCGTRAFLTPAAAQTIGILVHELATNAVKHGALSSDGGCVQVSWTRDEDGNLTLRWKEHGGPPVARPDRLSFGMRVIERNVPDQLGGRSNLDWEPDGLLYTFTIPAKFIIDR